MAESPNTHLGLSNREWAGVGIAGAGLLPLLFGGGSDNLDATIKRLENQTGKAEAGALALSETGSDILQPVSKYLQDITSGDRSSVLAATLPERRRIIDQYDAAKRSIAEFTPRGGGQASAMARVLTSEAQDLASTTAGARTQAFNAAGTLATTLKQLGISEQEIASGNLKALIEVALKKNEQDQSAGSALGKALGTIAGFFL